MAPFPLIFSNDHAGWLNRRCAEVAASAGHGSRTVVCLGLEASGGYERDVIHVRENSGFAAVLLNPRPVRRFVETEGWLAKNARTGLSVFLCAGR